MAKTHDERQIGRHTVELSSLDKVMFPQSGVTKGALLDWYEGIAPLMLPHVKDRPLSLRRWPAGIGKGGFFQKEAPEYYPDYVVRASVEYDKGRMVDNAVANSAEALVYLANQNVIELHHWCARRDNLRKPDKIIIDLDPHAGADFEMVRQGALLIRDALTDLGVNSFPLLTGSRGIHVTASIRRSHDYQDVADWTHAFADRMVQGHSDMLTTEFYKKERGDRVFVDWLRNQYAQTAVAPYSVRAKEGAPVAVPVSWAEVEAGRIGRRKLAPDMFDVSMLNQALKRGEVWEGYGAAQSLPRLAMAAGG